MGEFLSMVMGLEFGFCISQLDVGIILHAALSSCPEVKGGEETAHHKPYHSELDGTFCSRVPATPVTYPGLCSMSWPSTR